MTKSSDEELLAELEIARVAMWRTLGRRLLAEDALAAAEQTTTASQRPSSAVHFGLSQLRSTRDPGARPATRGELTMDANTYGASTVIRPTETPSLLLEDDGLWTLLLEDAGVAVILDANHVRTMSDHYLAQQLGGPSEDEP